MTTRHPYAQALLAGVKNMPHRLYIFKEGTVDSLEINYNPWLGGGGSLLNYPKAVVVSLVSGDIIAMRGFSTPSEARLALDRANSLI